MTQKALRISFSISLGMGLALGITAQSSASPTAPTLESAASRRALSPKALVPQSSVQLKAQLKDIAQPVSPLDTAQTSADPAEAPQHPEEQLDLAPEVIQDSPVLQRWLQDVPDVLSEIRNDPSFRTRIRLGYSNFPSSNDASGINVGIEDVFVDRTPLTLSADYQTSFNGKRQAYGADLRYYVLPLGSSINVAPVLGYRSVQGDRYHIDGVNVGLRLLLELSRTGAADIAITQSWVNPGSDEEVGITSLSFGYALTHNLRITTDLQQQNAPRQKDNRAGIGLEWML